MYRGDYKGEAFYSALKVGDIENGNYAEINNLGRFTLYGDAFIDFTYNTIYYVDGTNGDDSNSGLSWDKALATITAGVAKLNALGSRGLLYVAPGFYLEAAGVELTASKCGIVAFGLPEDTVWFGSGVTGVVGASTTDLLIIKGGNNIIKGMSLFTYKDDKASIKFDDTGGGYAGSFNIIENCWFSPQAQDGVGYGIHFLGGNSNIIQNCRFEGAKTAGILIASNEGNPIRNVIRDNLIIGCYDGISITSAAELISQRNIFAAGYVAAANYNSSITATAGFTAGLITSVNDRNQGANQAGSYTNGGAGTLNVIDPAYAVTV